MGLLLFSPAVFCFVFFFPSHTGNLCLSGFDGLSWREERGRGKRWEVGIVGQTVVAFQKNSSSACAAFSYM